MSIERVLETALLLKARDGPIALSSTPYTQEFNDNIYFNNYFKFLNGAP